MNRENREQSVRSGMADALTSPIVFALGLGFSSILSCIRLLAVQFSHLSFVADSFGLDLSGFDSFPGLFFFASMFLSCAVMQFGNVRSVRLLSSGSQAKTAISVVHALALAGGLLLFSGFGMLGILGQILAGASLSAALVSWGLLLARLKNYESLVSILLAVILTCCSTLLLLEDVVVFIAFILFSITSWLLFLICSKSGLDVPVDMTNSLSEGAIVNAEGQTAAILRNIEMNGALAPLIDTTSGWKRRALSMVVVILACSTCFGILGDAFGARQVVPGIAFFGALAALTWAGVAMLVEVPSFKKMFVPQLLSLIGVALLIPSMNLRLGAIALESVLSFSVAYFVTYVLISEVIGTKNTRDHPTFCWIGILAVPLFVVGITTGWFICLSEDPEHLFYAALAILSAAALLAVFLLWESTISDSGNAGITVADLEKTAGSKQVRNIWGEIKLFRSANTTKIIQSTYDSIFRQFDLSKREREVFVLLMEGLTVPAIAEHLFISPNTVKTHVRHIYHKLGVTSQRDLVRKCRILSGEIASSSTT